MSAANLPALILGYFLWVVGPAGLALPFVAATRLIEDRPTWWLVTALIALAAVGVDAMAIAAIPGSNTLQVPEYFGFALRVGTVTAAAAIARRLLRLRLPVSLHLVLCFILYCILAAIAFGAFLLVLVGYGIQSK